MYLGFFIKNINYEMQMQFSSLFLPGSNAFFAITSQIRTLEGNIIETEKKERSYKSRTQKCA